jgi:DNA-directed RNA polymerase specialized sigma24 family protein
MDDSSNSGAPLWFPKRDKSGGVFKKSIARAALKDWDRLREYAARRRIDSSFAADIVENIVKSMSAGRSHSDQNQVLNPGPYLFARFTRRIKRLAARERRMEYLGTPRELESCKASQDWEWPLRLENTIEAKEVIAYMDEETRRIYVRRMQGFSWKEIAKKQGMSVNTAIKAYSRGLARVRERMQSKGNESQSEGADRE